MKVVILSIFILSFQVLGLGRASAAVEPNSNEGRSHEGRLSPQGDLVVNLHRMVATTSSRPALGPLGLAMAAGAFGSLAHSIPTNGLQVDTILDGPDDDEPLVTAEEVAPAGGAGQGEAEEAAYWADSDEGDHAWDDSATIASFLRHESNESPTLITTELFEAANDRIRRERRRSIDRGEEPCPLFGQLDSHGDVLASLK